MNRRLVFLSAFAAMLMVSVVAFGQGQRQGRTRGFTGRGMSVTGLLRSEAVQKEIAVTEEQSTKLREVMTSGRQGFGNFREMSEEEREKAMAEFRKTAEEQQKKVAKILNKKQNARLEEIRIQLMGAAGAITDEAIAKKLEVTEEQNEKLAAARQKMRDAFSSLDRSDREAMTKLRDDYNAAVTKMLTKEQTAKLEKMKGKPFDLASLRGGRGGGRGGRGN